MADKFLPITDKEYLVTDFCFYEEMTEEERNTYNPYDIKRSPHAVQLIDTETGTAVTLLSGSIIKIVKAREDKKDEKVS